MNKKLVIGGVVLLLVMGGGAFLLLGKTEPKSDLGKSESDTIPTQWSQAGDYEIKEIAGQQTVVTNSKAGFSFKVPAGWITVIAGQDSRIIESTGEGCSVFTSILYQLDEYEHLKGLIARITENPTFGSGVQNKQEVIIVSDRPALQTSIFKSVEDKDLTTLLVEIPFGGDGIINAELNFSEGGQDRCVGRFKKILDIFSIISS